MLDIVFQNFTSDKSLKGDFFKKILEAGTKELGWKEKSVGVSINLVGESKIRDLNKKYRHKDKATDVLSFPMSERFTIQDSRFMIHDLGDIFICLSFAKNDAKSENVDIDRKLAQLTVHGFLHLAGYDHEKSEKDAGTMFKIEAKILHKLDKK